MHKLLLSPKAEDDATEEFEYYESQQAGLGTKFIVAMDRELLSIVEHPMRFIRVGRNTRKALIRQFGMHIYFQIRNDLVIVVGILHGTRGEFAIQDRVKEDD